MTNRNSFECSTNNTKHKNSWCSSNENPAEPSYYISDPQTVPYNLFDIVTTPLKHSGLHKQSDV